MPSIPGLRQSDTGVWYIHWTDGRRSRRVSTRTTDLDEAKAFLGQWLLLEREAPAVEAVLTCRDVWTLYEERHVSKKPATTQRTTHHIGRNVLAFFGDKPVAAVRQDDFDAYETARRRGRIGRRAAAGSTIWLELTTLQASWSWAAKRGLLPKAALPADLAKPEKPAARARWLSEEEIDVVLAAVREGPTLSRAERFVWLALETAARKQAIIDLTWKQVDFANRVIHYLPDGAVQTSKRRASVPISDALLPVLRRAFAERRDDRVIGRPRHGENADPSARIARLCAAAGVEGVTPHVFRHTAATHMAQQGVSLWIIAQVLGNTVAQVEKTYAKYQPGAGREAVNWRQNVVRTVERERPDGVSIPAYNGRHIALQAGTAAKVESGN